MYARIALLSQVIDVFHTADGADAALTESIRSRIHAFSELDPDCYAALVKAMAQLPP